MAFVCFSFKPRVKLRGPLVLFHVADNINSQKKSVIRIKSLSPTEVYGHVKKINDMTICSNLAQTYSSDRKNIPMTGTSLH